MTSKGTVSAGIAAHKLLSTTAAGRQRIARLKELGEFLQAVRVDPNSARKRWPNSRKAIDAAIEANAAIDAARSIEKLRAEERRAAFVEVLTAQRERLTKAGFDWPVSIDDWEHLARIAEKDPATMTVAEIVDWALAWMDRNRIKARLAAEQLQEQKSPPKPPRKRQQRDPSALTPRQSEAYQIFIACGCNYAETARRMNLDRKTAEQHVRAAIKKLGQSAVSHKTTAQPYDHRGQLNLSDDDDHRR